MSPAGKLAWDLSRRGYRIWSRMEPTCVPHGSVAATYGKGRWVEGLFGWQWEWSGDDRRLWPYAFPAELAGKKVADPVTGQRVKVRADEIRPGDGLISGDRVVSVAAGDEWVTVRYEGEVGRPVWNGDEGRHVPTMVARSDEFMCRVASEWWVIR